MTKGRIAAAHRRYSLHFTMGHPFPSKLLIPMGDLDPHLITNTWFLGPIQVHIPNGISIGSAVFAGLMIVTDRQTDKPLYSVMQPNNCKKRK